MAQDEDKLPIVSWDRVQEVIGHRMRLVDDIYPPRWEVESFPTADELAILEDES